MGPESVEFVKSAILTIIGILFIILSNIYKILSFLYSKEESLKDKSKAYNISAKITTWIGIIFVLFTIFS